MGKPIFTISGLRGIFGKDLTPELVMKYSKHFASYLGGKKIAVGRDTRFSGPVLFHAAVAGFLSSGANVFDFGICPTPAVIMMVKKLGLDGGIQITASHNPEEWNGIKFISRNGRFLYPIELLEFKRSFHKDTGSISKKGQTAVTNKDIIDTYIKNIAESRFFENIPVKNFKVGIDSCNGAAEDAAVKLVEMLGSTPISLKTSEAGFPRGTEPNSRNLKKLSLAIRKNKLDLGIAFDPDGDRFSCVDELGVPLSEESSVLLALLFILKKHKGPVVVNNSTTMAVDNICERYCVPLYRSKTGEINVVKMMQEVDAVVGGEGNGGVIVPSINSTRDGLVATAILLKLLSERKCTLSAIRKELPVYFMSKTIIKEYRDEWQKLIRKKFADDLNIKFNNQDGLKVIGKNFWLLLRKSNTEPILRIIAESDNHKLTKKIIKGTIDLIKIRS
jgi:phosphomannomutase